MESAILPAVTSKVLHVGFGLCLLVCVGCRIADNSSDPVPIPPKWLSASELKTLNEKGSSDDVNRMDAFVLLASGDSSNATPDAIRRRQALEAAVLIVKYQLRTLMFDVSFDRLEHPSDDPAFYRALVSFERTAKLSVDGVFTASELERLNYLAGLVGEQQISLPFKHVTGGVSYASAVGTWVLKGEQIASPINAVEIHCWRKEAQCDAFDATVVQPDTGSGSHLLSTGMSYYSVLSWTPSEVQAVSETDCRRNVLTLNWETQTAFTISTDKQKEGCPFVGPLAAPRVATLEDGFRIHRVIYAKRREALAAMPVEELRKRLSVAGAAASATSVAK